MLYISNGERSYPVKLPKNFILFNLNDNLKIVLIYAQPKPEFPFGWNNIKASQTFKLH